MLSFLRLLLVLFVFIPLSSAFAVDLSVKDQLGEVDKQLRISLFPVAGTPSFSYAFQSASIPQDEWKISSGLFEWTPKKAGVFTGTFSVIDGKGNIAEDTVLFSILPKNTITEQKGSTSSGSSSQNFNNTSTKNQTLRQSKELLYIRGREGQKEYYQPLSFYYTKGRVPFTLSLIRENQGLALTCSRGARFKSRGAFPYVDEVQVPSWISAYKAEAVYNVPQVANAVGYVLIDLPKMASISGNCALEVEGESVSGYRIYSFSTGQFSAARKLLNKKVPLVSGAVVVLTNDFYEKLKAVSSASLPSISHKNPYIASLYAASTLPGAIAKKSEKHALNREEMAALVIHTVSNASSKALDERKKKVSYWGYKDVTSTFAYRGEIALFESLGYGKGIQKDFFPSKGANMQDFFFALAMPLKIEVRWWEKETLVKALREKGLEVSSQMLSEPLTLERAAPFIFQVQEVLTGRGAQKFDSNQENIQKALKDGILSEDMMTQSQKLNGVSRADFLNLLVKTFYSEYDAYVYFQKEFVEKKSSSVVFSNITIKDAVAPKLAYLFSAGILPEEWKGESSFDVNEKVTRAEAVEAVLKIQGKFQEAKNYYTKNIASCLKKKTSCSDVAYDLQQDAGTAQEYSFGFYIQNKGALPYQDRFGLTLPLFVPEKAITLPDLLNLFEKSKSF